MRADDLSSKAGLANRIDSILADHWQKGSVTPANPADDATFLRRAMLDLNGRIPTPAEWLAFDADSEPNKRQRLIARLMAGPEFERHLAHRLDQIIQGRYAGSSEFIGWLEKQIAAGKAWDSMFEEMMLGPWEKDDQKPANRFLDKRAKDTDLLATDTARVFFGVDISCAKCHDHPLVADWTQAHYYGMAAFFNRTTGGKGKVSEKTEGEVTFLANGQEETARMMFLSGREFIEPAFADRPNKKKPKTTSRRERLVAIALDDRNFLSRSIVNRIWAEFFGRGIIEPVDQMHSESQPSVPGLLDELAEDFAANGYDLKRLIEGIVSSRAYQLDSRWQDVSSPPDPDVFAIARLRPLTRRQMAVSLLIATGNPSPEQIENETIAAIESVLDPRTSTFQSSTDEALFLSNSPEIQALVKADNGNLAARLAKITDSKQVVEEAFSAIYQRRPASEEIEQLSTWIAGQTGDVKASAEQLVWALVTSAEFRFNH